MLLPLAAALVPAGRAAVLAPTYSEHARAAALAGHAVMETTDIARLADADLAVVVNPNNPDGRLISPGTLCSLAEALASRGGALVVDEAFMDVGPADASLAGRVGEGLIVLRSFGKFFGLAGLRLGFAIAAPEHAARLRARKMGLPLRRIERPLDVDGTQAFGFTHYRLVRGRFVDAFEPAHTIGDRRNELGEGRHRESVTRRAFALPEFL